MSEPTDDTTDTETELVVNLIMKIKAPTPQIAVTQFVEELAFRGIRQWVYVVVDPTTGETVAELNGYGDDVADILDRNTPDEPPSEPQPEPQSEPEAAPDDLVALARGLNAQQ